MEDRINEINFIVDMVHKLCEEAEIGLIAKDVKGQLMVVVQDARNGKEYCMRKVK
ncbi:hypothetical protein [Clostridium sp. D46t1_190503_E9]|uniref:hypothetical protein n=1 Tax=Clostridium sp. D46t1_190503_E9 TaxID=2787137 RepID=UPI00189A8DAE|nr:hypothetical protein [Clostridium sp. D46t1_190503_E9]